MSKSHKFFGMLLVTFLVLWGLQAKSQSTQLPQSQTIGNLELVTTFDGAMPTGVTVSQEGRIFINFPRWGDNVPYTVGEVIDNQVVPYPNAEINLANSPPESSLLSVQSVVIDPNNRLWLLDTGRPLFEPASYGEPKLVGVDFDPKPHFSNNFVSRRCR